MNRMKVATFLVTVAVGGLLGQSCRLIYDLNQSDKLEAIGGVETYKRDRVAALLALKEKVAITDPVVRQQELDAIDRQISEIEKETTDEYGQELRRVK